MRFLEDRAQGGERRGRERRLGTTVLSVILKDPLRDGDGLQRGQEAGDVVRS